MSTSSMFDNSYYASCMIPEAELRCLGPTYKAQMQKHLEQQMTDKIAAEVAQHTTMEVSEQPDRYTKEYCLEYRPPEQDAKYVDWTRHTGTSISNNTYTMPACEGSTYTAPSACDGVSYVETNKWLNEETFSQWYRNLKAEINKWLN